MPGTKQIFESDYKKPLIGKLSRVVEHPHYITVMQPYRSKKKSGDTSSKYFNEESPEYKKPKSVLQLLEQSEVSVV